MNSDVEAAEVPEFFLAHCAFVCSWQGVKNTT